MSIWVNVSEVNNILGKALESCKDELSPSFYRGARLMLDKINEMAEETADTPQTDECEGCKHYVYQLGCTYHATCKYEPKEPQTESKLTASKNPLEIPTDAEDFTNKSMGKSKLKQTERGYMWTCPNCGLGVHSDFTRCPCCGYAWQTERSGE